MKECHTQSHTTHGSGNVHVFGNGTWKLNGISLFPSFVVLDETLDGYKEGCLSIPTFYEEVYRPKKIELSYQDLDGNHQKLIAEGVLSVCVQHEIDHLDGKLMVDYISPLKRDRIKEKLLKSKHVKKK